MNDAAVDVLRQQRRESALWLEIRRPERRNALSVELVRQLADAIEQAPRDTRAAVITGSGSVFCSGGDLDDISEVADRGALAVTTMIYGQFHRLVNAIIRAEFPVIAAVNGPALGAGLDLALACDLRYATRETVLSSSWIGMGLVPGMGGAHMLVRTVGSTRASEIALLGERFDAEQGLRWGLLNAVVDPAELTTHVDAVVRAIAAKPQPAVAATKASLRRATDAALAQELSVLAGVQAGLLTGDDFRTLSARFRRT